MADPRRCLLCGGALKPVLRDLFDTRFGAPGLFDIAACQSCGTEQLADPPDPGTLSRLYEEHYNFGGSRGRYAELREAAFRSPLARLWLLLDGDVSFYAVAGRGRLLEIGCNEGRGLERYRANGFDVEGLEINPVAAAAARGRGFVVHEERLEEFEPSDRFDVVVLSNVLEHFLDPAAMLDRIAGLVAQGGQVWISCPNGESWLRRVFGRHWINWHAPFHIVQFRQAVLHRMLRDSGFTPRLTANLTPSLWMAQGLLGIWSKAGRPSRAFRKIAILLPLILAIRVFLGPVLFIGNQLGKGDCLIVCAERI